MCRSPDVDSMMPDWEGVGTEGILEDASSCVEFQFQCGRIEPRLSMEDLPGIQICKGKLIGLWPLLPFGESIRVSYTGEAVNLDLTFEPRLCT